MKLRGQWVKVDAQEWRERNDLTINVGLGTGDKSQEIMVLREIMQIQGNAMTSPKMTGLAGPQQVYNTVKQLTRKAGLNSPDPYFTDPSKTPPQPPEPSPEEKKGMAEMQLKQQDMQMRQQARDGRCADAAAAGAAGHGHAAGEGAAGRRAAASCSQLLEGSHQIDEMLS